MEIKQAIETAKEAIDYFKGKIKALKWLSQTSKTNYYEDRIKAIKTLIAVVRKYQNIKWPPRRVVPDKMSEAINLIQYYEDVAYNDGVTDCKKSVLSKKEIELNSALQVKEEMGKQGTGQAAGSY